MDTSTRRDLQAFLQPLRVDGQAIHALAHEYHRCFADLAAHSTEQFLSTPIAGRILTPVASREASPGRYLAIDIGGTNLRVGFVELTASGPPTRLLEQSWPILEHLKTDHAESLFSWIGECIAEVVSRALTTLDAGFGREDGAPLPMGVTFSFPMNQQSLADATLCSMGKGFAITAGTDLAASLQQGYERAKAGRSLTLPGIRIVAITNDSVATLLSFMYSFEDELSVTKATETRTTKRKAAMGLIVGTGCNATVPLPLSSLHVSKRPHGLAEQESGQIGEDIAIAVNTEWSIRGTAPALRALSFITQWDDQLDRTSRLNGFQPLEYMTAGRYLGELGRLIFIDYLLNVLHVDRGINASALPSSLLVSYGLDTTWLSNYMPSVAALQRKFPELTTDDALQWGDDEAEALHQIALAIEVRAAAIVAAAVIGLLLVAGDLPAPDGVVKTELLANGEPGKVTSTVLGVGYTGGCIVNFHNYLRDAQGFLDEILRRDYGDESPFTVVLTPCHDGGVLGAGILCAAALL